MERRFINACGYKQFELDQTRYPIRGWQAAWLNSQTMRRELKRHDAIESLNRQNTPVTTIKAPVPLRVGFAPEIAETRSCAGQTGFL